MHSVIHVSSLLDSNSIDVYTEVRRQIRCRWVHNKLDALNSFSYSTVGNVKMQVKMWGSEQTARLSYFLLAACRGTRF